MYIFSCVKMSEVQVKCSTDPLHALVARWLNYTGCPLQLPAVHRRSSFNLRITSQLHIKLQTFTLLHDHSRPPFPPAAAALCSDRRGCL